MIFGNPIVSVGSTVVMFGLGIITNFTAAIPTVVTIATGVAIATGPTVLATRVLLYRLGRRVR